MTKIEYLEKQRDMAYHNLMCFSGNLSMTKAKVGCEEEWKKAKEECRVVEELINLVRGEPEKEVTGAAVIDGRAIHNWEQVMKAAEKVAGV